MVKCSDIKCNVWAEETLQIVMSDEAGCGTMGWVVQIELFDISEGETGVLRNTIHPQNMTGSKFLLH